MLFEKKQYFIHARLVALQMMLSRIEHSLNKLEGKEKFGRKLGKEVEELINLCQQFSMEIVIMGIQDTT